MAGLPSPPLGLSKHKDLVRKAGKNKFEWGFEVLILGVLLLRLGSASAPPRARTPFGVGVASTALLASYSRHEKRAFPWIFKMSRLPTRP